MLQLLDTAHLGRRGVICPGLAGDTELTLIDCGPATLFDETIRCLRAGGFRAEQVTHVLVTHIHLDHSGGAWRWATEFGATVAVHPKGAPHLADPTKLLASARRVFGDKMDALWGELRPVPVERLQQMVPAFEQFVWNELRASGVEEDGIRAYEQCDPAAMSAFGLVRYWRKHHPELFLHRTDT